jgi:hypothetical protein
VVDARRQSQRPPPKLPDNEQARWDRAREILAKADRVELFSFDPTVSEPGVEEQRQNAKPERFRDWRVLGKVELPAGEARNQVLAVAGAVRPGNGAKCFDPRHAIRATAGGKVVDLVICYECHWVYVFLDREDEVVHLTPGGEDQQVLDRILTDAKVPLPPRPKE